MLVILGVFTKIFLEMHTLPGLVCTDGEDTGVF